MESHRPRMRRGAISENQGNQQTLMAPAMQEEMPSRKISIHRPRPEDSTGKISGIRPNTSQIARETIPNVSRYFLRLWVRLTSIEKGICISAAAWGMPFKIPNAKSPALRVLARPIMAVVPPPQIMPQKVPKILPSSMKFRLLRTFFPRRASS